uniref:Uncharacterized protein n=1 Tax=Oryza barthii TaxID=65489 RepID=A0A0D3FBQ5_9ORYZ
MSGSRAARRKHEYPREGRTPLCLLILFLDSERPTNNSSFISALVEGDATGDELVVMMGLARELMATQRARAMT